MVEKKDRLNSTEVVKTIVFPSKLIEEFDTARSNLDETRTTLIRNSLNFQLFIDTQILELTKKEGIFRIYMYGEVY